MSGTKVFCVQDWDQFYGVFSTREKAEAFVRSTPHTFGKEPCVDDYIGEYEVDSET